MISAELVMCRHDHGGEPHFCWFRVLLNKTEGDMLGSAPWQQCGSLGARWQLTASCMRCCVSMQQYSLEGQVLVDSLLNAVLCPCGCTHRGARW